MTVVYARQAAQDLAEYLDYVAAGNPAEASRLRLRIAAVLDELAERPLLGRQERIRGFRRPVRSWPMPPLRIYYEPQPEGLFVVRIYHQARRPITR